MIIRGFGEAGIFIATIPEFIDQLERLYPNVNYEHHTDVASSLFNSSYHIGQLLGNILGAYFT